MEQLKLTEQDLINAVCFFHAKFKSVRPEDVEVELSFDDDAGYGAEACINGNCDLYNTTNFITAIRLYIDEQLGKDSISARIVLDIEDEMVAHISW